MNRVISFLLVLLFAVSCKETQVSRRRPPSSQPVIAQYKDPLAEKTTLTESAAPNTARDLTANDSTPQNSPLTFSGSTSDPFKIYSEPPSVDSSSTPAAPIKETTLFAKWKNSEDSIHLELRNNTELGIMEFFYTCFVPANRTSFSTVSGHVEHNAQTKQMKFNYLLPSFKTEPDLDDSLCLAQISKLTSYQLTETQLNIGPMTFIAY